MTELLGSGDELRARMTESLMRHLGALISAHDMQEKISYRTSALGHVWARTIDDEERTLYIRVSVDDEVDLRPCYRVFYGAYDAEGEGPEGRALYDLGELLDAFRVFLVDWGAHPGRPVWARN